MEEQNVNSAEEPKVDDRVAQLEAELANTKRDYAASSKEAIRLAQLNQQLQAYIPQPRQNIPNRAPYEEELETSGVSVNALDQLIGNRVQQGIAQAFEPFQRGIQARQTMVGRYKDYSKWESDMMSHINSDPELQGTYNTIFKADPVAAFDYAYLKFGEDKRRSHGNRNNNGGGPQEDQVEAQIPTSRSGDARRIPQGGQAAIAEAAQAYRQNPNKYTAEAYAKARFRNGVITDEFLNR